MRAPKNRQAITAPFDMKSTLQKIIEAARDIAEGVTTITIWYVDSDNTDRLFYKNFGCRSEMNYPMEPDGSIRRINAKYIDKILTSAEERFLLDARTQEPPSKYVVTHNIKSTIHLPLVVREEGKEPDTVGVMFLNFLDWQIFTEEDKSLYRGLATIAAASIRDVNMAENMGRDAFFASYLAQVQDIAHDLNSQLGSMQSGIVQLANSNPSIEQLFWIGMIEKQLNLLADGLPSLHTELDSNVYPVALDEIRQQVLKSIKSQHKSLGLTPNFDLPEGVILKANRSLLKRAVDHLLNNSLKPKHQVKHIFIQVDQKSHAPNKIRIIFADDGIGLTPEVEARILRGPVRQIGEDGRPRLSMGLLFARKQVESMGGKLMYLGKYHGQGAAFRLELNLSEAFEENKNG